MDGNICGANFKESLAAMENIKCFHCTRSRFTLSNGWVLLMNQHFVVKPNNFIG